MISASCNRFVIVTIHIVRPAGNTEWLSAMSTASRTLFHQMYEALIINVKSKIREYFAPV